ncbi:MAG TPA: hypothetical protein VM865_09350 [Acidobacteriaceae bacterium]|jgi:hypothetical protein|nr:hypothetical protein [Acidobacteriaceae bacterium]
MRTRALLATGVLFALCGCVDLPEVARLHDLAEEARVTLPRVSDDLAGSCQRRAALLKDVPADQLPPDARALRPDCQPFEALATHLAADQGVLLDYLDALAKLGSGQTLTYGKTLDAGIETIDGLSAAPGADADLAANAQKAGAAALSISKQLANLLTRRYRDRELAQLITSTDPAVQQLTKALTVVAVEDYGIMLNSERLFLDAYYQGPMAAAGPNEKLALILVQRQYNLDVLQLGRHRTAATRYARVMSRISTLHGELATAAQQPSGLSHGLHHLSATLDDLRDAIGSLSAEVK